MGCMAVTPALGVAGRIMRSPRPALAKLTELISLVQRSFAGEAEDLAEQGRRQSAKGGLEGC